MDIPIIDSHVHLWPEAHLPTIAWHSSENPLGAQYSVDEYHHCATQKAQTKAQPDSPPPGKHLRGFVYLEVDRISSLDETDGEKGWTHVLDEVSYLTRIALGRPLQGEGHSDSQRELLLAFIPWAPVPAGPVAMERYLSLVKQRAIEENVWCKMRGVRYLVQDKPPGTMIQPDFIKSLRWLGRRRLTFDLGVDARQGGLSQLQEAVTMIRKAYDEVAEKDMVAIVINHLCKPNLHISPTAAVSGHPKFLEWKRLISTMAAEPPTYMKLSGLFSELPAQAANIATRDLVEYMLPWLNVVFESFGPQRIMFGSDWPICNLSGGGAGAWAKWHEVVAHILDILGLSDDDKAAVWGGTAAKAYGLDLNV
ncbi:amidohydrolase family protein [Talaromyces proteolyticus]|uniref:Amidohydrolase family protein n=1 Tax=Talaromyces proteolyticus TaxID=1131652 RepID=A0AAD4KXF1_9EURO|nr:amidohydrolase family protein [Talaromyces proteolyticus]KAH8698286.1 amidohydrolase family protein [Talaromyces proteolyticus]